VYGGIINPTDYGSKFAKSQKSWRRHRTNYVTDEIFALDTNSMTWIQPVVAGTDPGARFRHCVTMWETKMILIGGHHVRIQIFPHKTSTSFHTKK
jgi:hypothetical protein